MKQHKCQAYWQVAITVLSAAAVACTGGGDKRDAAIQVQVRNGDAVVDRVESLPTAAHSPASQLLTTLADIMKVRVKDLIGE